MTRHLYKAKRKSDDQIIVGFYRELSVPLPTESPCVVNLDKLIIRGYITVPRSSANKREIECEVYRDTVCECTGVYDKHGTQIFEHDRCRISRPLYTDSVGTIKFNSGSYYFVEDGTGYIVKLCELDINNMTIEIIAEGEAQYEYSEQ